MSPIRVSHSDPFELEDAKTGKTLRIRVIHGSQTSTLPGGRESLRVLNTLQVSHGGGKWGPLSPSKLLTLPADHEAWVWLREQGIRRPSPSGKRRAPKVPDVRLTLSAVVTEKLGELASAHGLSRSGMVSRLVLEECARAEKR